LKNVYFKTSEAVLLPESYLELDKLAQQMLDNPLLEIRLEGHTDAVGDPAANLELSKERANSVKEYLVLKGVQNQRIETKGFGSTRPLVKSGDARQQNRRVEFVITKAN
jgi:outer membrane protein OmpA-like peptidoglycan-associated protein